MNRYSPSRNPSPNRRRSPHLITPKKTTFSDITAGVLPSPSWVSSRGLDMCLLAVCSCALSLLCHQTSGLANLPSVNASSSSAPASGNAAQVDFTVKAGLLTSRQNVGDKDDQELT